ncbi:hypothetical protein PENTCL1PPCAC_27256, partial [Pristionchus entomophagus]
WLLLIVVSLLLERSSLLAAPAVTPAADAAPAANPDPPTDPATFPPAEADADTSTTTTEKPTTPSPKDGEGNCIIAKDGDLRGQEAEIRCLQGMNSERNNKKPRFNCKMDKEERKKEETGTIAYDDDDGMTVHVCFINHKSFGSKKVDREELIKIITTPVKCKVGEEAGELVLVLAEYRCFWEDCNENIDFSMLNNTCIEKILHLPKADLVPTKPVVTASTAAATTTRPVPTVAGDLYLEVEIKMDDDDGHHEYNGEEEDNHESGHNNMTTSSKAVAENQLAIVLITGLARLL